MAKQIQTRFILDTNPSDYNTENNFLRVSSGGYASGVGVSEGVNMPQTAISITGEKKQGLTATQLSETYIQLNVENIAGTTLGGKACYWYIKNTQPAGRHNVLAIDSPEAVGNVTDVIVADDGDQVIARLAPGEFMYFCSADNTKLSAKSAAGVVGCEYMCFHME